MSVTPYSLAALKGMTKSRVSDKSPPDDKIALDGPADAIVAGFGRFGQIVGRVLTANGFSTSTLDSSIEQIDLLRRFGRRVYYGDATRLDLLRAAGAERAKLLVVAIDDPDKAVSLTREAREAFPHLKIMARAYDRRHAYELTRAGADWVERETFEAALTLSAEALRSLGYRAHQAERAVGFFRRHDRQQLERLAPLWGDEDKYVLAARESSDLMDRLFQSDLQRSGARAPDDGWDTHRLYDDLREHGGRALDPEEEARQPAE